MLISERRDNETTTVVTLFSSGKISMCIGTFPFVSREYLSFREPILLPLASSFSWLEELITGGAARRIKGINILSLRHFSRQRNPHIRRISGQWKKKS